MKFLRNLFGKSAETDVENEKVEAAYTDVLSKPAKNDAVGTAEIAAAATRKAHRRAGRGRGPAAAVEAKEPTGDKSTMSMIRDINAKIGSDAAATPLASTDAAASAAPSIWDLDEDTPSQVAAAPVEEAPAPVRSSARQRRTKTRLIGFEKSDGNVVDAFSQMPTTEEVEPAPKVTFPVGWILVVQGPGRGESFPLINGLSSIGRSVDQTVALQFGDASISRQGHAAIVYDNDERTFTLGHGNKANIVRLNDQPLISKEQIKNGDLIRIGETTLRLVTLCGDGFDWTDFEDGGDEDVAIA